MRPRRAWARLEVRRAAVVATLALCLAALLGMAARHGTDGEGSIAVSAGQVLFGPSTAWAQAAGENSLADIPPPTGFVNDRATILSETTRAELEAFLDQLKQKTTVDFAILTVPRTAPETPSEYKVRVFQSWKLGQQGKDNGLLLLIAIEEREARFETGYGLEGTLPDGLQSRIVRELMVPRFRQGDWNGGVVAGVLEAVRRIGAEQNVTLVWDGRELRYRNGGSRRGLPGWVIVLLIVLFLISIASGGSGMRPRRRRGLGFPGAWGGGFGGFGGGFGGGWGGGGFGGGGGGSFGGFGGGRSGGGGGGGSW